jgi:hypothetical protein
MHANLPYVRTSTVGNEKKEYSIHDCSELERESGGENRPSGLRCRVGPETIYFAEGLSEEEHIEIAVALQNHLPMVAQKICSYPNYKEHFITLGLGTPR